MRELLACVEMKAANLEIGKGPRTTPLVPKKATIVTVVNATAATLMTTRVIEPAIWLSQRWRT